MNHSTPRFARRPPWWPENEPWPPRHGRFRRNPFFRRLGCLFGLFNLAVFVVFLFGVTYILKLLGVTKFPLDASAWVVVPVGAGVFFLILFILGASFFSLRRILTPLDDLLEAAGRVAGGDYSVRVAETGIKAVRSLSHAFNNMAAALSLTNQRRRELLADVTHELRTPLTVIRGNLEGMLDGVYPADETNLRALLEETNLLSRLIDDLRTLALAESGALQLKKETTDLLPFLHDVASFYQSQADAAGVRIVIQAAGDFPMLDIDPVRMRQVLNNLLSNSLRYSPPGSQVSLTATLDRQTITISVQDEGPGIAEEDLPHVFERFYKSTDSGGMGLGLAIAKHLVEAHGGQIAAENAPQRGTIMRVSLPLGN